MIINQDKFTGELLGELDIKRWQHNGRIKTIESIR